MIALACLLFFTMAAPVSIKAQDEQTQVHQENPDTAEQVYSNLSLLFYYNGVLDLILQLNTAETELRLNKLPLASIPEGLSGYVSLFSSSGKELSYSLADLSVLWEKGKSLLSQYRLQEAYSLYLLAKKKVPAMLGELDLIDSAVTDTGQYLKISSLPPGHVLNTTYNQIKEKIKQIRELPDLFEKLIQELIRTNVGEGLAGINLTEIDITRLFKPVDLTLALGAEVAFVGDGLFFEGLLSYKGQPLGAREIKILLNDTPFLTAVTNSQGRYQGTLQLPYRYTPELKIQALFHPEKQDQGVYLAALSKELTLNLLYYEGRLPELTAGKAYPGKPVEIKGDFEYRLVNREKIPAHLSYLAETTATPDLFNRPLELFLDDTSIAHTAVEKVFSFIMDVNPQIETGTHTVTLFARAQGRLAPVNASCLLEVAKAAIIMDLQSPDIVLIPGSFTLSGSLHSLLGPLEGAQISVAGLHTSRTSVPDKNSGGNFETIVKVGMDWSLLGTHTLDIHVQPQEPWNASLNLKKNLFMINYVNLSILIVVLAVLSVFLSIFLRKRYPARTLLPVNTGLTSVPAQSPVSPLEHSMNTASSSTHPDDNPGNRLLYWFRKAVGSVQAITGIVFKPSQTLREFDQQSNPLLGPLARFFHDLVLLVEKVLYSRYKAGKADEEQAAILAEKISKAADGSREDLK